MEFGLVQGPSWNVWLPAEWDGEGLRLSVGVDDDGFSVELVFVEVDVVSLVSDEGGGAVTGVSLVLGVLLFLLFLVVLLVVFLLFESGLFLEGQLLSLHQIC